MAESRTVEPAGTYGRPFPDPRPPEAATWTARPAREADASYLVGLRDRALRPSLEAVARYDPVRVRERFLTSFEPRFAWVIEVDGETAGCVALRPDGEELWLEHFLIEPGRQGAGVGSEVLAAVLDLSGERVVRLNVLQRSDAERLYRRHGFERFDEDEIDIWMLRPAATA